ncbi:MAG: glycosyltransferase [Candidatus Aminicenantales bacterium]
MSTPEIRLSIIVPAFNEEKNVPRMVEEITAAVDRLKISYEVIFIDDGSRDGPLGLLDDALGQVEAV